MVYMRIVATKEFVSSFEYNWNLMKCLTQMKSLNSLTHTITFKGEPLIDSEPIQKNCIILVSTGKHSAT